ncbi:MAG: TIGR02099 family protein [Rhodoferax sp.]|nr:TIGR02099 family protein [Rhodoferax sp.]
MDDLTPAPSPLLRAYAFVARWSLRLLLTAWLLLALSWGLLHLLIVPRIGELRPYLERSASHVLGVPVKIESIAAYSTGIIPAFELTNMGLYDPEGREALRLPRVLVSLSAQSLLALKFDQLYVDHPTLNVRRAADGKLFVAGLDVSGSGPTDGRALDHLFSQPELVIRQGSVVWTDEQRQAPPLVLRDVDLVMRNSARRHEIRLDATPPAQWGERFGLLAKFEQPFLSMNNGRWREWSGQVFASFDHVEVSELKRYTELGIDVQRGRGAVRAWVDVRLARVVAATADLALADVSVRLQPTLAALELNGLSGRLTGNLPVGAVEVSTQGLGFETVQGLRWPGGNFRLLQTEANATRPAHGELSPDQLDLAALSQIASRLPLGPAVHAALERHDPKGVVDRLGAKWVGPADALTQYSAQGRVRQLRVKAIAAAAASASAKPGGSVTPGVPGIEGADLDFELTESGGKASLLVQDGSLTLPGIFAEPQLPFSRLAANLAWQIERDRVKVQASGVKFSNADTEGELQLQWQTSDPARSAGRSRFPGLLDMQGSLSRAAATRVHRYLPLVLHENVRFYLRDAVQGGTSNNVRFKVKGDLYDLPYANPRQGEFSLTASVRDGVLAYVPSSYQSAESLPWPVLGQLSGDLVFDRSSLRFTSVRASLLGSPALQLSRGEGLIADLLAPTVLALGFDARGPLADMLSALNGSPMAWFVGNTLARASASGSADLRLKLSVPLAALDKTTVQGNLALTGNDFQLAPDMPRLARARGAVAFSETGFSLNAIQTRVLGGDVRIDGGSVPVLAAATGGARAASTLSFRAQGTATAEGLRQARELGAITRLAQYATGAAAYSATFALRAGLPEISVTSTLAGMALDLPAPLNKAAEAALPLRVESTVLRESMLPQAGGRVRLQDQLSVDMGRIGSVTYVRDQSGPEPRVLRGAIGIGLAADESAVLPVEGVMANVNLATVDLDAWSEVLTRVSGTRLAGLDAPVASAAGGPEALARGYLPNTFALRARELSTGGRKLRAVLVGGSRDGSTWRANVDSQELNGYVEYRQALTNSPGRVFARLSRLTLAAGAATDVEKLLDEQPASIPALDIVVDEFELQGKRLGRVDIEAVNRAVAAGAAGVREWRLNRFDVTTPEAAFRASGNWAALNPPGPAGPGPGAAKAEARRTVMNFRLDINNSGDLLGRFGMKDIVRRGKGVMEGQVAWAGSPLALDYASLGGAFNVNIEGGQFLKADPGLAKLLGVLSLQSLPRRLALDFRDVFSEGFVFDFLRGDVRIERGIASSNNLQMKGVNAAVLMDGRADLARETQDIRVVVVPEINAGTASLIATVINPAIGLGSFLAQLFLRRPLIEAATQEFHVEGSWADPKISKVPRRIFPSSSAEPGADGKTGVVP